MSVEEGCGRAQSHLLLEALCIVQMHFLSLAFQSLGRWAFALCVLVLWREGLSCPDKFHLSNTCPEQGMGIFASPPDGETEAQQSAHLIHCWSLIEFVLCLCPLFSWAVIVTHTE